MGGRELSRHLQRDVKRTHEDAQILVELGLIEYCRNAKFCVSTHAEIHVNCALPASVGSTLVTGGKTQQAFELNSSTTVTGQSATHQAPFSAQ